MESSYPQLLRSTYDDDPAKAADAHDSNAYQQAIDTQRQLFDKVHGPGAFDGVRSLYTKVDAIGKIGAKFDSLSVVKPTPANLLHLATAGNRGIDPGMIDGAALRRAVQELSRDTDMVGGKPAGVFDRAGIKPMTVRRLQDLGRVLELSDPSRLKSKISNITGHTVGSTVVGPSALTMAHTLGLAAHAASGGTLAASAVAGWGANKLLGYLMTNPKALDYTLRAARTLAPAAWAAAQRYQDNADGTGTSQPIQRKPVNPGPSIQPEPNDPNPFQGPPPAENASSSNS